MTTEQMIEGDRAMIQDFRIELIQMMENAGRTLAHLASVRFFDGDLREKNVVVLAGTGVERWCAHADCTPGALTFAYCRVIPLA